VDAVVTHYDGLERAYLDDAAALLVAAGRFVDRVAFHDRLADLATSDPLGGGTRGNGTGTPVADIAAESGLALGAERADGYDDALRPYLGLSIGHARLRARHRPTLTSKASGPSRRTRRFDCTNGPGTNSTSITSNQWKWISRRRPSRRSPGHGSSSRAARSAASERRIRPSGASRARTTSRTTRRSSRKKHTSDLGVLADLFADGRVSDVFANAPVTETPLTVRVDGELRRTNVRVTRRGADAGLPVSPPERPRVLACEPDARRHGDGRGPPRSRRRDDGAGQRRAQPSPFGPTTGPPGRSSASSPTTRSRRMPPRSSHWLSNGPPPSSPAPAVPARRLMLGALLWELSPTVRVVLVEDTPELRSTPSRRLGGTSSRCERTAAMGREFRQRRRCEQASASARRARRRRGSG